MAFFSMDVRFGVFLPLHLCVFQQEQPTASQCLVLHPVLGVAFTQCRGHIPACSWLCLGGSLSVQGMCSCALAVPAALRGSGTSLLAGEHLLFQAGSGKGSQDTFFSLCALCIGISAADIKEATTRTKIFSLLPPFLHNVSL